jgi:hypothetical protein
MRLFSLPSEAAKLVVPVLWLFLLGLPACGVAARAGKGLTSGLPLIGNKKEAQPEIGPAGAQVPLGEVSYVEANARFVLVRTGRTIKLKTGAALEARRNQERVAELSYSPEYRQGFLVADILRGNPAIGDLVMIHSSEILDLAAAQQKAAARETAYKEAVENQSKARGRKRLRKR